MIESQKALRALRREVGLNRDAVRRIVRLARKSSRDPLEQVMPEPHNTDMCECCDWRSSEQRHWDSLTQLAQQVAESPPVSYPVSELVRANFSGPRWTDVERAQLVSELEAIESLLFTAGDIVAIDALGRRGSWLLAGKSDEGWLLLALDFHSDELLTAVDGALGKTLSGREFVVRADVAQVVSTAFVEQSGLFSRVGFIATSEVQQALTAYDLSQLGEYSMGDTRSDRLRWMSVGLLRDDVASFMRYTQRAWLAWTHRSE